MSQIVNKQTKIKDEELDDLYNWLEGIKLSKPKKNLARDFSDGRKCSYNNSSH